MATVRYIVRLVLTAAVAAAACIAALVLSTRLHGDEVSSSDLSGFGLLTFVGTVLVAALFYTPAQIYMTRRRWTHAARLAASVIVVNLPVYLLLVAGMQRGMLSGATEALLFGAAFAIAAAVFALTGDAAT